MSSKPPSRLSPKSGSGSAVTPTFARKLNRMNYRDFVVAYATLFAAAFRVTPHPRCCSQIGGRSVPVRNPAALGLIPFPTASYAHAEPRRFFGGLQMVAPLSTDTSTPVATMS